MVSMYYVYILRSEARPNKIYIGLTRDLDQRIKEHNQGGSQYTKVDRSWKIEMYIAFRHQLVAEDFERYLKAGSGFAFLKKRFLPKLTDKVRKTDRSESPNR